ncbi:MAG: sulfur carrier protein ThiS [Xanthomonadales bacterium]|nr:sulfur carrier protein ThiS [Xanthomonadales bacterium]
MEILLNGRFETVEEHITVGRLLEQVLPPGRRVAVEVNHEIVPRTRHDDHSLSPGDRVEIVQAIGGG